MNKPHWCLLISLMQKRGIIKTGLTIPYLYGAYKRLGYDINRIEDLLIAMCSASSKEVPVIGKCDVIHFDVVKPVEKALMHKSYSKDTKIAVDGQEKKLIISVTTRLGGDLKRVCTSLEALYQQRIDDEEYSYNLKENRWKKFSEGDYEMIDSVK